MAKAIRILMLAGAVCASACSTPRFLIDAENARTNTHVVLAFEETVFNKHRVREGFSRYVSEEYREHDPDLIDGSGDSEHALDAALNGALPSSRIVVRRTVAQGDLVAVHALWDRQPGKGPGVARVDIYRLVNARIAEHWLVQQPLSGNGQL
jgi:predicted SnoaL-like aldol condensation-catalyzing enzyme